MEIRSCCVTAGDHSAGPAAVRPAGRSLLTLQDLLHELHWLAGKFAIGEGTLSDLGNRLALIHEGAPFLSSSVFEDHSSYSERAPFHNACPTRTEAPPSPSPVFLGTKCNPGFGNSIRLLKTSTLAVGVAVCAVASFFSSIFVFSAF